MLPKSPFLFDPPRDEQGFHYHSEIVEKVPDEAGPPYWIKPKQDPKDEIRTLFHLHERCLSEECLKRLQERFPERNFELREFPMSFC